MSLVTQGFHNSQWLEFDPFRLGRIYSSEWVKVVLTPGDAVVVPRMAIAFFYMQYLSWVKLVAQDVFLVGNPSGSFVYIFSGLHLAHLIGGLVFLLVVFLDTMNYKVHSKSMLAIEMCTTYWHFLGGLWIYLYLFLVMNN